MPGDGHDLAIACQIAAAAALQVCHMVSVAAGGLVGDGGHNDDDILEGDPLAGVAVVHLHAVLAEQVLAGGSIIAEGGVLGVALVIEGDRYGGSVLTVCGGALLAEG